MGGLLQSFHSFGMTFWKSLFKGEGNGGRRNWKKEKRPNVQPLLIMLADDHAIMRQEMKKILSEKKDFQVIGEAGDGVEVMYQLALRPVLPHLVILDLTMPHLSGIEVARRIRSDYPEVKVLILTIHREEEYVKQAITIGVHGYLLKEDANAEIFSAIEKILKGEFYLSPLLRKKCCAKPHPPSALSPIWGRGEE